MCLFGVAQTQNEAYLKYIQKYKSIALKQEKEYKIPACITLAQGLLESGAGNSELAVKANNHFGIKCHKDWTGDTYTHDDETRDECFRKYKKAEDSYVDHSRFLLRPRYASLFDLPITDYKGWAHGLKQCGYATDPGYAAKLIKIIEDYDLASITTGEIPLEEPISEPAIRQDSVPQNVFQDEFFGKTDTKKPIAEKPVKTPRVKPTKPATEQRANEEPEDSSVEDVVVAALSSDAKVASTMGSVSLFAHHKVEHDKLVRWVIAMKGDTYELISYEFNIELSRILKYNNATRGQKPTAGQRVYLTRHK